MPDMTVAGPSAPDLSPRREEALRRAAQDLEAAFLAEMLRHSGFGAPRSDFGGGAGEGQFASFLRTEHARALAGQGAIGLAESLFRALAAREEAGP